MATEKRESELKRLRREQSKTRHDEVYGGLSPAEQAEYNRKSDRIHELEGEIQASAIAEQTTRFVSNEHILGSA
jgi:hypothetical protein